MGDQPRHVVVVSCLVRNAAGQVLMIRHCKRGWEIPQGRVEECEDLVTAVHREIREEAGVEVKLGPLALVYSKLTAPSAVIFCFLGFHLSGEPRISEETPEVGWFDEGEVLSKITHPVNLDRVRALLCYDGTTLYRGYSLNPFAIQKEIVLGQGAAC